MRAAMGLLLYVLFCTGADAQSAAPLQAVSTWSLDARDLPYSGAAAPTHRLQLALFVFRDTAWDPARIREAVSAAAPIFAQCGVHLNRAELRQLDGGTPEQRDLDTPVSRDLVRSLLPGKPAVFLVRDTRNQPAFEGEAFGRGNTKTRPELAGTVWLTAGIRDQPIALAHELAHVLMDSGEHVVEPGNLMREDTAPENTKLSPEQCRRLREQGSRNGWLRPAPRAE